MNSRRSFKLLANLKLKKILELVSQGELNPDEALEKLKHFPTESLEFARIDHHRAVRQGFAEVIYCEGKADKEITAIAKKILEGGAPLLATRASAKVFKEIKKFAPNAVYHERSRAIVVEPDGEKKTGSVLVMSAGTSDIPVAEEAVVTASVMGSAVETIYDVGVAGIHRLFDHMDTIKKARVIVVTAGMDGALASVVGGLVEQPVIAVPTSVGYGAAFGGISALLAMLNSCAAGVSVVNIDNGFGAGALAHKINVLPDRIKK